MITNNHVIDKEALNKNEIIWVTLNDDNEIKNINLKNKNLYTNETYDTTIIEINPENDKIYEYLEFDEALLKNENEI